MHQILRSLFTLINSAFDVQARIFLK